MAVDPYTSCPGGTGKKIKFCCPDLVTELDTLQTMLAGDQRRAALEEVNRQLAKTPDRACLLTTKAMLESELGETAEAGAAIDKLLAAQPTNPVALAQQALLKAQEGDARAGIEPLQRALAACTEEIPAAVYNAIGALAEGLLVEGDILAARAHLLLQLRLNREDKHARDLFVRLHSSSLPLVMKDEPNYPEPPADALWKDAYEKAVREVYGPHWIDAERQLAELAKQYLDAPAIWTSLATVRGWLADAAGAVDALRHVAALKVPLDEAVEAEALAQLLDESDSRQIDELMFSYDVKNIDAMLERLASDRRLVSLPIEQLGLPRDGTPPPRVAYWLLDRVLPPTGVGLKIDDAPNIIGRVLIYGRETDREPRLELQLYRDNVQPTSQVRETLAQIAGDALGELRSEQVVGFVSAGQLLLSWNWRLPDDTPPDQLKQMLHDKRRQMVLERWPKASQHVFDDRPAAEVAADPQMRIRVLAALLLMEQAVETSENVGLVNELARQLGLPENGPLEPAGLDIRLLPLVRLARLDVAKLSDEQLLEAQQRAAINNAERALVLLTREIVRRPSLEGKIDKAGAYGMLASLVDDSDESLELLHQAQAAADAAKQSSARWDLDEFMLRLQRGEAAEASRILQHVQTQHGREPGVQMALMQLLASAGLIDAEGRPRMPGGQAAAPGLMVPGAEAEPGKLWTPGGEAAPGKKSALWTPGMD